ncbi:MAG: CotH kinase family protein [bacterium]
MKIQRSFPVLLWLIAPAVIWGEAVINEIHYNPPDNDLEAGSYREFIELYNPGAEGLDLTGYEFAAGITYKFPAGMKLSPGGYLVIARVPTHEMWRNKSYAILGPYEGKLSDSGEVILFMKSDGTTLESFRYSDSPPWPIGCDGYGSSLERISWDLPAEDYHSWRPSLTNEGTPGRKNSVASVPSRPVLVAYQFDPPHPSSRDSVVLRIQLDTPSAVASVNLRWERAGVDMSAAAGGPPWVVPMERKSESAESVTYEAVIPPARPQTLIRCNVEVIRPDGQSVRLPHAAEPNPFLSYFVYDGEITSLLPILWILPPVSTTLITPSGAVSAVACLPRGASVPDLFDGAEIRNSRNGLKARFIKGREFYGDRTINIIPEEPAGGTNPGASSPFREHLGFWFYREMNVLSPWAEFYRIITLPAQAGAAHKQQLAVEQVNENFLEMNGLNPLGDLYKRVYSNPNWEKHTNKDEGTDSIKMLEAAIQVKDPAKRREAIERYLDQENFLNYSVASVLTSNWDGYWNNHWMYLDPRPGSRWVIIPWDLDWLWGSTTAEMYARMPLSFPIDGEAIGAPQASRAPGPITAPLHKDTEFYQEYERRMRIELGRRFTIPKLMNKMDEIQTLLLNDLELIEQQTGTRQSRRYNVIRSSYADIKRFVTQRWDYLNGVLPVSVEDWAVY